MTGIGAIRSSGALLCVAALVAGCGDDTGDASTAVEPTAAAAETSTWSDPDIDASFDLGGGRALHLRCAGVGEPTILLEAGDESGVSEWSSVAPELAAASRTCSYDRAGVGASDPAEGCRGLDHILDDLDALLQEAEVPGPFVFVGASGGGYLAAGMAERHPDEVAGLVLVDTFQAIQSFPPGLAEELRCDAASNIERRDYVSVEHDVWDDRHAIGDFPLVVITNDYGPAAEYDEIGNVEAQQGWFVLSPQATQVVVDSGHDVTSDEPDVVVDAVLDVLAAAG